MTQRRRPTLRTTSLALAPLVLGLLGCPSYPGLAGRYADAEVAAAGELSPMGALAYQLCRKEAAYEFVLDIQNLDVEPPPWPVWYGATLAPSTPRAALGATPVTWQQYCDQSERAASVIHAVSRGLRAHGRALAALASGQPFDAGGLENTADGIATASAALGASTDFGTNAREVGSAFATATKTFVDLYREHQLERIVAGSDGCMQQTFAHLTEFAKALDERLSLAEHSRETAVRLLARTPSPPRLDRALVLAEALEAAGEADHDLRQLRLALGAYHAAITSLAEAHQSLAVLADPRESKGDADVKKALTRL
ncbi:MAG TPA: hypothetical protein VIF09_18575, partial [Polyangiaceae bacterium]